MGERFGDCRNGVDDPDSPVWDAPRYALTPGLSGHVVHAAAGGELACEGPGAAVNGSPKEPVGKDPEVIPRGYYPVCTQCHEELSERVPDPGGRGAGA